MLRSLSKPLQYALVAVLAVAAWLIIGPILNPEQAVRATSKLAKPKSQSKSGDLYLPEDRTAHFEPVSASVKNAFKPFVAKAPTARNGPSGPMPNVLPPEFAGGESNWVYTGTAEIDGDVQALLENRTTGDTEFLKVGDTWKGITVEEITDDSLVLMSAATGLERTLKLPSDDMLPTGPAAAGYMPATVNPALSGPIGPMTLQPDNNAQTNADDASAAPQSRRSRRRGGNRGSGFGG